MIQGELADRVRGVIGEARDAGLEMPAMTAGL